MHALLPDCRRVAVTLPTRNSRRSWPTATCQSHRFAVANADVPPSLDSIYQQMMAKDPGQPSEMTEVVGQLEACLRELDQGGPTATLIHFAGHGKEVDQSSGESSFLDASVFLPSRLLSSVVDRVNRRLGRRWWVAVLAGGLSLAATLGVFALERHVLPSQLR